MTDSQRAQLRDVLMTTFRTWGGHWNVSPTPPGQGDAPADRWRLRIHSRPIAFAELDAELVEAYLSDPADPETAARWDRELRPIFEHAKATDELL